MHDLTSDEVIPELLSSGIVATLLSLVRVSNTEVQLHATGALRSCARLDECINYIRENGGLEVLLDLLRDSPDVEVQKCAAGALKECSRNVKAQVALQQLGGLDLIHLKYPVLK